jgi:5'-nucleotidase
MKLQHAVLGVVVLLGVAGCTSAPTSPAETAGSPELRRSVTSVLLTDDDGWDAPGISEMFDTLTDAGFEVLLVAPKENSSGSSMSTSGRPIEAQSPAPDKWWVDGTPVESVRVGLTALSPSPPDLVISGINHGANSAYNVNYSGTVGAAIEAAEAGIPAIAVSADVGPEGSTVDFAGAALLVVEIIKSLSSDALSEMSRGTILNVNAPYLTGARGASKGIAAATQSLTTWVDIRYVANGSLFTPEYTANAESEEGSDKKLLAAGYSTVTTLTVSRDASHDIAKLKAAIETLSD